MEYSIEKMKRYNWSRVRSVYLEGIATGHSTYEAEAPDWETFDGTHLGDPRLVAKAQDQLLGWTALTPVSSRCAYSGNTGFEKWAGENGSEGCHTVK